jgi:hypothetical protein
MHANLQQKKLGVPLGLIVRVRGHGMIHAELHGSNSASVFLVILIRYFDPLPTSFIYNQLELYTKSMSTQSFVA